MNTKKANLHIHSNNSDGIHSARAILKSAKKQGIEVLSITDHNEIGSTLRGHRLAKRYGLIFFPGMELLFGVGGHVFELLAYFENTEDLKAFYREYRYENKFMPDFESVKEVVNLIKKYKGAVVVPHPFGRKGIFRKYHNRGLNVDAIEIINAFTGEKRNIKARRHEDKDNDFIRLGAADMHFFLNDLSKVYTELTSKKEITKEAIWDNLIGNSRDITFKVKGRSFKPSKIIIQKPFCPLVYAINYPRLFVGYHVERFLSNLGQAREAERSGIKRENTEAGKPSTADINA